MARLRRLAVIFAAAVLALAGCRESPERGGGGEELLGELTAVAEKSWDGILIEFGSPSALPHLSSGWSYGETAPDGATLRWVVSEQASFHFESDREGPHFAWFECEPFRFDGAPTQWIEPTVNGETLDGIELRAGRERYPLEIPLRRGDNRVDLRFRYAGAPDGSTADRRPLAVAFYRFDVPFASERPRPGLPGPFAPVGSAGVWLPAGGTLRYYLELSAASRLRVSLGAEEPPRLRAPRNSPPKVAVRTATEELVPETLLGSEPWERELPPVPGRPVAIELSAGTAPVLVRPELWMDRDRPENAVPDPSASLPIDEPNLLVVVLDGANALRTGLYGYSKTTTPALDALGRQSVVFETAVSQAVYTIASIGSFLTGQYPDRHQNVSFADRLPDEATTVPEILTRAGLRTAGFSGNAVVSRTFGLDQGYEEFHPVWERKDYTGHGDSVLRAFQAWLEDVGDARFFAYVHFREPHFPYNPPAPFDTRLGPARPFSDGISDWEIVESINRRAAAGHEPDPAVLERIRTLYEGNLAYVDSLLSGLVGSLEASGLADKTILIVTSDHGEALYEHGYIGHNTQLYEESIRIPLVIRIPKMPPKRVAGVVELLDVSPTILDLAGVDADAARRTMQGESLLPLLRGEDPTRSRRIAFSRTVWDRPRYAARTSRFKLIWDSRTGRRELYDLDADPDELVDAGAEYPLESGFLKLQLFRWVREQERLRAGAPPPDDAAITESERRMLESLGYAQHVEREKR